MSGATSAVGDRRASVVVLAKDSRFAKTRLGLPSDEARRLAVRLAGSTVRAALAAETVGSVLVVTGDPGIALDAAGAGAVVVTEPRPLGMNRAADLGRRRALELRPHAPIAVMVADLPALRPSDVDAVLMEFLRDGAPLFVADAEGTGTTFLVHGPHRSLGYGFGRGSAAMHQRLGYLSASTCSYALCRDLDTPEDLADLAGLADLADLVAPERLVAS